MKNNLIFRPAAKMQNNPAYAVPSEARTTAANSYEYIDNIPTVTNTRRNIRQTIVKRSLIIVAMIFSIIALVATLTCLILIIKQQMPGNVINEGN